MKAGIKQKNIPLIQYIDSHLDIFLQLVPEDESLHPWMKVDQAFKPPATDTATVLKSTHQQSKNWCQEW